MPLAHWLGAPFLSGNRSHKHGASLLTQCSDQLIHRQLFSNWERRGESDSSAKGNKNWVWLKLHENSQLFAPISSDLTGWLSVQNQWQSAILKDPGQTRLKIVENSPKSGENWDSGVHFCCAWQRVPMQKISANKVHFFLSSPGKYWVLSPASRLFLNVQKQCRKRLQAFF